jgi:membrane dipeptidase
MIRKRLLQPILLFLIALFLGSCTSSASEQPPNAKEETLEEKAQRLAQELIITDGHVDLPYRLKTANFRLQKEYIGIPIETDKGDFDYVRAKKGGLDAPFMSIYLPSETQNTPGEAKMLADSLINMVVGIAGAHPDKFAVASSPDEVEEHFRKGLISLPMGMENGAGIENDLKNVKYFYEKGIRYITLTHAKDNLICDSSYDTTGTWGGLSPFGRKVVAEMNRVGIMVDVSHISDDAFYDVMAITDVPVIASHSSCRHFTPGFERNMSDDMLRKLADNGGVIQINFGTGFLDGKLRSARSKKLAELRNLLADKGWEANEEAARSLVDSFKTANKDILYSDVQRVADHIDHVAKVAGIDHVGLGSDFDGVGDSLPAGLKDVSQYPNLIEELLRRGYSEKDIAKICYENVFRVWRAVEKYAQKPG